MSFNSVSNSSSIRDIENKYGISLTSCNKHQLDSLTSSSSRYRVIRKLSDLMINTHQFDLSNMTDIERTNLKYLVMSTEEVIDLIRQKASIIYHKPAQTRLRSRMTFDDFYQSCAYKVMLNDGILRFNADYKLEPAIYCWLLRNAMWQAYKRAGAEDELVVLDAPCSSENDTSLKDLISTSSISVETIDHEDRVKNILNKMSKDESNFIVFKAGSTQIPLSEYNLAKLFMVHHLEKKELSKIMYNTKTEKLVSNQIFNKFYKQTLMHIAEILQKEANFCGEKFSIDSEDL